MARIVLLDAMDFHGDAAERRRRELRDAERQERHCGQTRAELGRNVGMTPLLGRDWAEILMRVAHLRAGSARVRDVASTFADVQGAFSFRGLMCRRRRSAVRRCAELARVGDREDGGAARAIGLDRARRARTASGPIRATGRRAAASSGGAVSRSASIVEQTRRQRFRIGRGRRVEQPVEAGAHPDQLRPGSIQEFVGEAIDARAPARARRRRPDWTRTRASRVSASSRLNPA